MKYFKQEMLRKNCSKKLSFRYLFYFSLNLAYIEWRTWTWLLMLSCKSFWTSTCSSCYCCRCCCCCRCRLLLNRSPPSSSPWPKACVANGSGRCGRWSENGMAKRRRPDWSKCLKRPTRKSRRKRKKRPKKLELRCSMTLNL